MDNKRIEELQILENQLQNILLQKQAFQMEISEAESSLNALKETKDAVFKMVGQLMVKADKNKLQSELDEKIKLLSLRLNSLDKQENSFSEKLEKIREEVLNTKTK